MAIVKFGPMVVGARGTIAGTIFSANLGGPFVRGWSRGSNPRTASQQANRGVLTEFASLWRDLTTAEKDDWIDYADDAPQEKTNSLGETYFASGFNWFVAINSALTQAGDTLRDDAPTLTRPVAPVIDAAGTFLRTTAGGLTSVVRLDVASPGLTDQLFAQLMVTGLGRTTFASNLVFMANAEPNAGRRVFFQTELELKFGDIFLNQRMFLSVQTQGAHGQRGPAATIVVDSTAV